MLNIEELEGHKILIVDDNKINVMLAQTVVKKYKILTDTAGDGVEALELFKHNDYDLVLTDIQMPTMDGTNLTRAIRALDDKNKSEIPVLGVTANIFEEDRVAYLQSGMNDLVLKPFTEKELMEKIATYLKP